MGYLLDWTENVVGKKENADYQHFLLYPLMLSIAIILRAMKTRDCLVKIKEHKLVKIKSTVRRQIKNDSNDGISAKSRGRKKERRVKKQNGKKKKNIVGYKPVLLWKCWFFFSTWKC